MPERERDLWERLLLALALLAALLALMGPERGRGRAPGSVVRKEGETWRR